MTDLGKKHTLICDLKTDMLEDELALLTLAFNPLLHNTPLKYHVFETITENGTLAPFSIIFSKVFKTLLRLFLNFFQCCLKIETDVMF